MNKNKFKFHYLLSLLLSLIGSVIFFAAIIIFLFFSSGEIKQEFLNPNSTDASMTQMLMNIVWEFLFKSLYAITGLSIYAVGIIWNIIISFIRGETQKDHSLGIAVSIGWLASLFVPILGLIVSIGIQIWGYFKGIKE